MNNKYQFPLQANSSVSSMCDKRKAFLVGARQSIALVHGKRYGQLPLPNYQMYAYHDIYIYLTCFWKHSTGIIKHLYNLYIKLAFLKKFCYRTLYHRAVLKELHN